MTDDVDADAEGPTPESDPRHLDPAGDFADFFEESDVSVSLDDDTDAEELREFVERAEAGDAVTAVQKSNVLKHGDGMFLEECRAVAEHHTEVDLETALVDAFAMELVREPASHDVVVTTNLFGDVLSDEAAGVVGSLGLAPALNHGEEYAMAQATHGAAPDIAGEGVANPLATVLSAAMLLDWLDDGDGAAGDAAAAIERAVTRTVDAGVHTPDLGGDAATEAFADAVLDRL